MVLIGRDLHSLIQSISFSTKLKLKSPLIVKLYFHSYSCRVISLVIHIFFQGSSTYQPCKILTVCKQGSVRRFFQNNLYVRKLRTCETPTNQFRSVNGHSLGSNDGLVHEEISENECVIDSFSMLLLQRDTFFFSEILFRFKISTTTFTPQIISVQEIKILALKLVLFTNTLKSPLNLKTVLVQMIYESYLCSFSLSISISSTWGHC